MKKKSKNIILSILLIVMTFSLTTKDVSADIGGVEWEPYTAWVTNKNGTNASYFKESDSIYLPYGTRIYVWNGDYDVQYSSSSSYLATYDERTISVQGIDILPLSRNPSSAYLTYKSYELCSIDDATIYNGPGEEYGILATIVHGDTFESDYNDGMYAHVKYNGKQGWVYFRQVYDNDEMPKVYIVSNNEELITKQNTILQYSPGHEDNVSIPKDTTLECNYFYVDYKNNTYANVIYEGNIGWIKAEDYDSKAIESEIVDNEEIDQEEDINIEEKIKSTPSPIFYAVGGAIVSALVSFVVIKLLNKKIK